MLEIVPSLEICVCVHEQPRHLNHVYAYVRETNPSLGLCEFSYLYQCVRTLICIHEYGALV